MRSGTWYDLSAHGLEMIAIKAPSKYVYVGLRGKPGSPALASAAGLRFEPAPSNPALMVRKAALDPNGNLVWPFTAKELQQAYPGAVVSDFDPARHFFDRSAGARPAADAAQARQPAPAASEGRALGPNALGQAVHEAPDGSRYATDERNRTVHEAGTGEDQIGNFLRARRKDGTVDPEALLRCAQGFVESAVRGRSMGKVEMAAFMRTTHGAAHTPAEAAAATEAVRTALSVHLARRGGKTLREAFASGEALWTNLPALSGVSASAPPPLAATAQRLLGMLGGSDGLAVSVVGPGSGEFLTHLPKDSALRLAGAPAQVEAALRVAAAAGLRGAAPGDATGSDRLILNLPPGERDPAARVLEAMDARNPNGIAVVLVDAPSEEDGPAGSAALDALRDALAVGYQFEAQAVVDGALTGGRPRIAMCIGPRREEEDRSALAPQPWRIEDWGSLWTWAAQVVSERANVNITAAPRAAAALQGGRTEAETNAFQVPYVSASQVGKPRSMVPRNLEGATREALSRAAAAAGADDVDSWVAREFSYSLEDLGRLFSPEQVDALALYLNCERRARGFLDADQTGLGKGRVLAAIMRRSVLRGERALFLTERQVNLSDIWRDIIHIESAHLFKPLVVNEGVRIIDERNNETLFGSAPRADVEAMLDAGAWPEGANLVMGTYSQFSREVGEDGQAGDRSFAARKAEWLATAMDPSVHIVADECHNASSTTSNSSNNVASAVKRCHPSAVYSSATFAKDAAHMAFYAPLFPDGVSTTELEGMMSTGGESFQEVLSWMLAHDGVMIRREFDLSRVTYQTIVDTPRFERNRAYMDAVAPILSELVKLSGDVDGLMRRQNAATGDEADAAREERGRKVKPFHLSRVGFGQPLYNISRLFVAALKVDATVEDALKALQENKKPVIMVENTVQTLLTELSETEASMEGSLVPDFRALFHRTLRQMTTARWTDEKGALHLRDMSESDPAMAAHVERLKALIDDLPTLPVSSIDEVKRRIREAGWSIEEITGRDVEVVDGKVVRRPDTNPTLVKNAFNSGDLDALVINVAGSTGIDLHASGRFADQRKRRLIELQAPADILRKLQSHGRINRWDQVEDPEVVNIMSGLPVEMRLCAIENAKVRRLSANVTSNRDAAILTRDIPDLINPVGDEVCARYAQARPDLMRRLGFSVEAVEKAAEGNLKQEEQGTDIVRQAMKHARLGSAVRGKDGKESEEARKAREQNERKVREGAFQVRDSRRSASEILARLIMLPTSLQEQVCRELTAEFNAAVEEMEARGDTPLRTRELPGIVHERERRVFDGAEGHAGDSVFHEPLYVLEGAVMRTGKPMRIDDLMDRIQIGNMASGRARACVDRLRNGIEEILRPFLPEGCLCVADALVVEAPKERKDVTRRKERVERLADVLERLRPGREVGYRVEDKYVKGIVTRVEYPDRGYEHVEGGYGVEFVLPGDEKPRSMRLSTLMRDAEFEVGDGLEGREYDDILKRFEGAEKNKLTQVQILTHNVFRAVRLNWEHRLGKLQTFVGADGTRHRGVVLSKANRSLHAIPVELDGAAMAWEALSGRGAQIVGNATLADKGFSLQPISGGTLVEARLPKPTSRLGYIYDHPHVAALYRRHVPDGKGSAPRLILDTAEARGLVEALYEAGARFYCNPLERKWALEYMRAHPSRGRSAPAPAPEPEDEAPEPVGMVA